MSLLRRVVRVTAVKGRRSITLPRSSSIQVSMCGADTDHASLLDQFAKPVRKGGRFENPKSFKTWEGIPGATSLLKYKLFEKDNSSVPSDEQLLSRVLPIHKFSSLPFSSSLAASWLGHATVLVQMDGATFITDPVWSARASPYSLFGPSRYRKPPCEIEDLPDLDFGVISHDHYDHLDMDAVKRISSRFPSIHWFVPLGFASLLHSEGIEATIHEMNWGDSMSLNIYNRSFSIHCTPAQHWGQRGIFDRNKRLWAGFAVRGPKHSFYYSGDTGDCSEEFEKIGRLLGPFDLAAIPIGCYEPSWFMRSQHIGPTEAVKMHQAIRSRFSIGIHWGTYHMGSYEHYLAPRKELHDLVDKTNLTGEFTTLPMGLVWTVEEYEVERSNRTEQGQPREQERSSEEGGQ